MSIYPDFIEPPEITVSTNQLPKHISSACFKFKDGTLIIIRNVNFRSVIIPGLPKYKTERWF